MKVILYMAISANGFIAKPNHDTPWTDAEWESYSSKVKSIGNLIVGKTTYDLMVDDGSFDKLGNPTVICLTSSSASPESNNHFFVNNFDAAILKLNELKFDSALVGGGGACDTAALESNKLSEIYLDIEPHIFGKGIPLFRSTTKNLELKLFDTKKIGENGIQLHYKVKR